MTDHDWEEACDFMEEMQREEDAERERYLDWMRSNLSLSQLSDLKRLVDAGNGKTMQVDRAARDHIAKKAVIVDSFAVNDLFDKRDRLDRRTKAGKAQRAQLDRQIELMRELMLGV